MTWRPPVHYCPTAQLRKTSGGEAGEIVNEGWIIAISVPSGKPHLLPFVPARERRRTRSSVLGAPPLGKTSNP